jgi:hypothetical protein
MMLVGNTASGSLDLYGPTTMFTVAAVIAWPGDDCAGHVALP